MNLQTLLDRYLEDSRLKQLADDLTMPGTQKRIVLHNVKGSAISFIASTLRQHLRGKSKGLNHVVVLADKEEAAYFQNDLEQITRALDVFFFPDSFKNSGNYAALNSSHIMLRTEALTRMSQAQQGAMLITYPEAIFEKVVQPSLLSQNTINIRVNEQLDVDGLLRRLTDLGFRREDFAYEPGQFAMRGGILDIYSFGNEHPYRIELFGNEVDSIRIFHPETQLSERKLLQVSILPNIETNFDTPEKISLFQYLSEDTLYWFNDLEQIKHKMQRLRQELKNHLEKEPAVAVAYEDQMLKIFTADDFEDDATWFDTLQQRNILQWNAIEGKQSPDAQHLTFHSDLQPVFNRNFELLIADLSSRSAAGYTPYIFAENPHQLERLRSIFEDSGSQVNFVPVPIAIHQGFVDHDKKILAYTDHQIFQRYHKYRVKQVYSKSKAITLRALRELVPGDYVTHIDHGVGVYSGLQKIEVNGNLQETVRIIYRDNDVLYVNINSLHKISKYTGKEGTVPKVNKLGSDAWEKLKNKTKRQVKDIAANLIRLYARRKASQGFAHSPDSYLQAELEASFYYEDTPDQSKATLDVKRDMEQPAPMDRLVCGDVGFGKTEVAVRAAFKTVCDSKQAAVLVPTTILAYQHYQTFKKRLKDFPANVDYINRFKSAKEKKETIQKLAEGKIDIIIGTHALLSKDVHFKDLGLLIIDEEQKFGVAAKEKLRERKANVDTLTLTATPIPRTLQFSLMNARDLSLINTPPPNRQPVHTELIGFDEDTIRDALYYEVERGGQVYFVHNRVQSLPAMVDKLRTLCPDIEIEMVHGQMDGKKIEQALLDFIDHKFDVLCCTNIVESGVDISNANTIIINNAHQFGLSDLHQLRGRVGRSNKKAFCYLVAPSLITLPDDSRKRLKALEQFNELGSGFQIAMRDLDIRGAGNLLGGEQSGFIAEIGFEMYQKILAEAIRELKQSDFKDVFAEETERKKDYVSDCTIDTDLEILIPDNYVQNISERLTLYTQLDHIERDEDLLTFEAELKDRFGPIPPQVQDLLITIRCRRLAKALGFEKMILKNRQLRLYFISDPEAIYFESETFKHIMQYIQRAVNFARLKQIGKNFMLIAEGISSMRDVEVFLQGMQQE